MIARLKTIKVWVNTVAFRILQFIRRAGGLREKEYIPVTCRVGEIKWHVVAHVDTP